MVQHFSSMELCIQFVVQDFTVTFLAACFSDWAWNLSLTVCRLSSNTKLVKNHALDCNDDPSLITAPVAYVKTGIKNSIIMFPHESCLQYNYQLSNNIWSYIHLNITEKVKYLLSLMCVCVCSFLQSL